MKVHEALARAAAQLQRTSDSPRLDAELLMAHALDVEREQLLLRGLDGKAPPGFATFIERRAAGEPVAYITGRRAFWTIELEVGPGALIPRADSETLIEAALDHFGSAGPSRILDLGTGPGTLLLAALDQWPRAQGLGVDRSAAALAMARPNAERLGFAERVRWREGDWAEGLDERFDLILCNPPYVARGAALGPGVAEYEPQEALFAGADGLDDYRRLAPALPALLAPGGIACVEIGAGQAEAAGALFAAARLDVRSRNDLAGHVRCLILSN